MRRNNEMMNVCRRAVSIVAGADSNTMRAVAEMRMRSEGINAQSSNGAVSAVMAERRSAAEDFSF